MNRTPTRHSDNDSHNRRSRGGHRPGRRTGQQHPLNLRAASNISLPAHQTFKMARKWAIVLLCLTFLVSLPAAIKGIKLSKLMAEGLWAYTWARTDGVRNSGGYQFSFTDLDDSGAVRSFSSSRYNSHTRLRGGREFGRALIENASRFPELGREPLVVYVHPFNPKRSLLAPGIPLLAVYQLLALMIVLVPSSIAFKVLVPVIRGDQKSRSEYALVGAAALFYLVSLGGASIYMATWSYLSRSMPPSWPLLGWATVSAYLFLHPGLACRLYDFTFVRRTLYLCLILGVIPAAAVTSGLALPYIIAATAGIIFLTVLIKPLARAGNTPLYALLISLLWVPIYAAGMLAPARALVQMLHEILPYMPYNIGITGIENPRLMAHLDVAVGVAGIVLSILITCIDSIWRSRQAAQVALLPTSKARSAAIGLVELQGRARHVSPSARGPILHYNARHPELNRKRPFYLEDDSGRILIDPGESHFRTGWKTSFGGRITEIVLKRREQKPDLTTAHDMRLMPGDPIYVIGTAQINQKAPADAVGSERLVVQRRRPGFFQSALWQISQGKFKPQHRSEDIFFLTDSDEQVATRRIRKGLWQVWAWAFLWIAISLTMFHFQMPRTQDGYKLWSMQEIIEYAAPQDRLEAVLEFFERNASLESAHDEAHVTIPGNIPVIGSFVETINTNLMQAQFTEGVNFLWQHPFEDAPLEQVQILIDSSGASSKSVRWWAVSRLGEATGYPDIVVPVLIEALQHDLETEVRASAASSLKFFQERAFPAIPALVAAARSTEYKIRKNAIWTLTRWPELPDGPAHALFLELIEDEAGWVRQSGVQGLRNMANHSVEDAQVLMSLTTDQDPYTRSLAIGAIHLIDPNLPGYAETVARALRDKEEVVRANAVHALGKIGTIPDGAAAPLGAMITDRFRSGRVLSLLVDMGDRAAPAVPYLAAALENRNDKIVYNAAFALSRVGPAASSAVDELIAALTHRDSLVRKYCAEALGAGGQAAAGAIPALVKLEQDPDPHVSGAARSALYKIKNSL